MAVIKALGAWMLFLSKPRGSDRLARKNTILEHHNGGLRIGDGWGPGEENNERTKIWIIEWSVTELYHMI